LLRFQSNEYQRAALTRMRHSFDLLRSPNFLITASKRSVSDLPAGISDEDDFVVSIIINVNTSILILHRLPQSQRPILGLGEQSQQKGAVCRKFSVEVILFVF
jgi:hypothetical protein